VGFKNFGKCIYFWVIESGDSSQKSDKFEDDVNISNWFRFTYFGTDFWWESKDRIDDHVPKSDQRYKIIGLVRPVHGQTYGNSHQVHSENNLFLFMKEKN